MSAVSIKVTPTSIAFCTTATDSASSHRAPKLLVPSPATETRSPELPRFRYSTHSSLMGIPLPLPLGKGWGEGVPLLQLNLHDNRRVVGWRRLSPFRHVDLRALD